MALLPRIIPLALILTIGCTMPLCASDGPFFHQLILKRNKYVTYKTHYPDDVYLSYEGDVDIPFHCYYPYNSVVQLVLEIVRPSIKGFRRVDVVLYMGTDRKLVGMDREVSKVKTFIVNTPDTRPLRPFEKVFQEVDLILTPTAPTPAFKLGEKTTNPLEMYLEDIFTITANIVGIPAISVPAPKVAVKEAKMPFGFQLMGKWFDEETILNAAYAFEQN